MYKVDVSAGEFQEVIKSQLPWEMICADNVLKYMVGEGHLCDVITQVTALDRTINKTSC